MKLLFKELKYSKKVVLDEPNQSQAYYLPLGAPLKTLQNLELHHSSIEETEIQADSRSSRTETILLLSACSPDPKTSKSEISGEIIIGGTEISREQRSSQTNSPVNCPARKLLESGDLQLKENFVFTAPEAIYGRN